MLEGRIFVTGGAGFLARALYQRAEREGWPCTFTAYSRHDADHAMLGQRFPNVRSLVGDVLDDVELLAAALSGHDVLIHAAARKYVDRGQYEQMETTRVNVLGSINVAHAALRARVPVAVAISTDKAAAPVNVYGLTKAIMEHYWQGLAERARETRFVGCRYGNVVGSTGSVATVWRRLQEQGQPIVITDPDATRFWMSYDEAIDCIVYAAYHAADGSFAVPAMRASSVAQLAHAAIGIENVRMFSTVVGLRPGEKRHESIIVEPELERIMVGSGESRMLEIRPSAVVMGSDNPLAYHGGPVTSDAPPGGWIGASELGYLIDDAEAI